MDTIDLAHKQQILNITNAARQTKTTLFSWPPDIELEKVDMLFLPGHGGLTGVRINYGGTTILPWGQTSSFVFGASERLGLPIGLYIAGPLSIVTTNTDNVAHLTQLVFYYHEFAPDSITPAQPFPLVTV